MANKKLTEAQIRKQKAADAVTYKVVIALFLLFFSILSLMKLDDYYNTIAGFDRLYPLTLWALIGGLVVAAACAVLLALLKKPVARLLLPWGIGIGIVTSLTAYFMRTTMTDDFPLLYLLCGALLILYIIFQLYRWEFFLFSAVTFVAGCGFYQFSRGVGFNLSSFAVLGVLLVVCVLACGCVLIASRNKGKLILGKINYKMFSPNFNTLPVYLAAAFWLVCAVAVFFLGSLFSYYCMFAAIAAEFIAAVYYTVQLR